MKKSLFNHVIYMIQLLTMAITLQCLSMSFLHAWNGNAPVKSIEDVSLHLSLKEVKVEKALKELESKTEFNFVFDSREVRYSPLVSVESHGENLFDLLVSIANQSHLSFKRIGQIIHVKKSDTGNGISVVQYEDIPVSGTVKDENGDPIPGATILVKGTNHGTVTELDGSFALEVTEGATLVISFVGHQTEEVLLGTSTILDIVLQEDYSSLNEVVVVGYGVEEKRDLTGAISSIKSKDILAIPSSNNLEALQGRISGLDMVESSGAAGSTPSFTVRGNRSLTASNAPLILVDGIPYTSGLELNSSDIKSMEVLKDASATAIYGTRGANGVILVTTKRGEAGQLNISLNSFYGNQRHSGLGNIQNGEEFIRFKREAFKTQGITDDANIFNPAELEAIANGDYVEWMREVVQSGSIQNHEISINGGNDKTRFNIAVGYFDELGLFKNDRLKRYNGSVGVSHKLAENVEVSSKFFFTYRDNDRRQDPLNQANKINPFGRPYDEEGNIILFPVAGQSFNISPLADEVPGVYVNKMIEKRLFNSSYLDWEIINDLKFRTSFGMDLQNDRRGYYYGSNTLARNGNISQSGLEHFSTTNFTWENLLTYSKVTGEHEVDILLGNSLISMSRESSEAFGYDQVSETTSFYDLGSNVNLITINSGLVESALSSVFGRVKYKWRDRYLLTATLRADGASVLSENNQWGYFPSIALGWRVGDEPFMQSLSKLSDLKIRASWGKSGNSAISPYQTLGGLGKVTYSFGETPAFGYYPRDISNPDLTWETTATINLGLDFGFFDGRVNGSLNLYQSKTNDLLMERILPSTSGFSTVFENVGKTQNKGIELELSTFNITSSDNGLEWKSDFTFSSNREEILALTGGALRDLGNGWIVGQPTQVFYDFKKIGIWQLDEETEAAAYGQMIGDIKVLDVNNDGAITPDGDRMVVGNPRPDFSFGVNNTISFKNFDISAFIYGRYGLMIRSEVDGNYKIDGRENGPLVDYWTPENPTNSHPRPDMNKNLNSEFMSTLYYVEGSFLKVKNVTLGYSLPNAVLESYGVSSIRIYTTLRNYFTFSKMDPYDPERGGSLSFPMTKQMIFGLNINF